MQHHLFLPMAFDQILQFFRFGNADTPLFSCPYLLVLRLVGYYVSISCWAFVNDSQKKYIEIDWNSSLFIFYKFYQI